MEGRWKAIIVGVSLLHTAVESYLTTRQKRVLSRRQPPAVLAREITTEAFDKSQAYGRAKANFSLWSNAYGQICNVLFVYLDAMPRLWRFAGAVVASDAVPSRFAGEKSQSVVFLLALMQVQQLLGLPTAWYSTFCLEEAFGFNKQTLGLWVTDMVKSNLLVGVMAPPVLAAFLAIVQRTGSWFFVSVWLFIAFLQAFMVTIYPIFILPLFNKLSPLEQGPLKDGIDALAKKLAFPLNELYVIDGSKRSSHSNAYFFGMPWKKHIVLYDTLLEQSDNDEVIAVLAHELGHWKLGHTTRLFGLAQVGTSTCHGPVTFLFPTRTRSC
jgi:STE24 endopeptidase